MLTYSDVQEAIDISNLVTNIKYFVNGEHEIYKWLNENVGKLGSKNTWDYRASALSHILYIWIHDEEKRIIFKLTWVE